MSRYCCSVLLLLGACCSAVATAQEPVISAPQIDLIGQDSLVVISPDSCLTLISDTLAAETMPEGNFFSRVVIPLGMVAAVGTALLLLFTQRGN